MASASDSAKPMNAMPCSWPRAPGWRATRLMNAANTMPTPIPGPMAERPYPTTFRLPVMSLMSFQGCARGPRRGDSVLVGDRRADVGRREHDEDVCLYHLDEGLEEREDDAHAERERREQLERHVVGDEEHVLTAEDEYEQQQVAGEHVAEKSQREGDRPQEDVNVTKEERGGGGARCVVIEKIDRGGEGPPPPPGGGGGAPRGDAQV